LTSGGPRCSAESLDRGEPLYATASLVSSWLLIEQPGAWGPDALMESGFPPDVGSELSRRAGSARILLIRRRSASKDGPVFFTAHSGGDGARPFLVSAPLTDPSVLLDVDLDALAAGHPGPGTTIEHPIYLVCTHGRHDICCADKGRPLYRAMARARPDRTWEVSHLGGDRFAGNLLVLPRGDYFGRLEPEDAEPLASAYEQGRLDLARHRGRSTQPRLIQAAEHYVRESEGLEGVNDLTVIGYQRFDDDRAEVAFASSDGSITVEVAAHDLPELDYLTCRADQPDHPVAYDLVSLARSARS
jgi:hypothetical protein